MQQDSLTKDQQQAFSVFKEEVKTCKFDDQYLLRFLKARQFDVSKAKEMWNNFINWRIKNDIDNIQNFEFTEIDKVRQYYPHGYFQVDKQGRPIYIERIGMINAQQLWKVTNEERMLKYLSQTYENLINVIFPALSKHFEKNICKNLVIFDLKGLSIGSITQIKSFIQLISQLTQNNYPEILGAMYIINAPMFFSGAWKVIKGFFDQNTQNKIQILDSKFKTVLLQNIDLENLPNFLGGQGECDLKQNKGPWNIDGLELYGDFRDIQEKNKKFITESSNQMINQSSQDVDYKMELNDSINIQEIKKVEQENDDDFKSIDNNQFVFGRKSDQSVDQFFSLSENRVLDRHSVDYRDVSKKVSNDLIAQNSQIDYQTINNDQSISDKIIRGKEHFMTFGSIEHDKRRLYSVDFLQKQSQIHQNKQVKIKINPSLSAVQIYKYQIIMEQESLKKKDQLLYLFDTDKIVLNSDQINLASESQQDYSLSPKRYYVLFGHIILIYSIFMSNYSLYSNQEEFATHFLKTTNQINMINYISTMMTGLFYIFLIFFQTNRLQQIGSVICLLGIQIRLVDQFEYLFAGQCLIGIAKPFILLNQQNIVIQWFLPQNRSLIYNIISINTILACSISFVIKRQQIQEIFYVEAIICSCFILMGNMITLQFRLAKSPVSIQAEKIQLYNQYLETASFSDYIKERFLKIKEIINFQFTIKLLCFGFQFNALKTQMLILQYNVQNSQQDDFSLYLSLILSMMFLTTIGIRFLKYNKFQAIILQLIGVVFVYFQNNWFQIKAIQFLNIGLFMITPILLSNLLLEYDVKYFNLIISIFASFANIISVISYLIIDKFQNHIEAKDWNLVISIYLFFSLFCYTFIKEQKEDFEKIEGLQIISLNQQNDQQIIHCF